MIFARQISDNLTGLVKKIDAATAANSSAKMGSFVVFLNDDEDFPKRAAALARRLLFIPAFPRRFDQRRWTP